MKTVDTDTDIENKTNNKEDENIKNIFEDYKKTIYILCFLALLVSFITLIPLTLQVNKFHNAKFWLNQVAKYSIIFIIQFICGICVTKYNVKVNYTRKIIHMTYFFIPYLLDKLLIDFNKNVYTELWNMWLILFSLFVIIEPIRNKFRIIQFLFSGIDRPEDRPYTLLWLSTQLIISLFVIIPMGAVFKHIDRGNWIFIPIFINGLGDGLAEPVGIRFGKHKYKTKALCTNKEYNRSYEGSFCVFFFSVVSILIFLNDFKTIELIFCLILMPILCTIAEAYSPHTWDSAFIYGISCLILLCSYYCNKMF
jgi:phytol kinase